ncbi:TPA: hypothetical protein ACGO7F_001959 [Streptococcus suis]|uniref:hypothetical protein n=1 Tax=Streptococcus suis TaxID=1307 RepID=UPI00137B468F|nr:hypothetical protein [Streptococcus suis]
MEKLFNLNVSNVNLAGKSTDNVVESASYRPTRHTRTGCTLKTMICPTAVKTEEI